MNECIKFPIKTPAIKFEQPLGVFYVVKLSADVLLEVTYSTPATAVKTQTGSFYNIFGSQRDEKEKRLKEIAQYIDTVEAAFPNSIILGANYDQNGLLITENGIRWEVTQEDENDICYLNIPSSNKVASLIDGQHRLHAFKYVEKRERLNMPLLCAVYLDIPLPYHAYVFATINMNQKKVDRSLAYELFGFSLEEEPSFTWAPETLSVYLVRLLSSQSNSPFYSHIKLGVQENFDEEKTFDWQVSMATVVDGILSLISSNPKKDRDIMHKKSVKDGRHRKDIPQQLNSPLRQMYIDCNDKGLYAITVNYFKAVNDVLWLNAKSRSYIKKTVGIQALFDLLKIIIGKYDNISVFKYDFFYALIKKADYIDFSDNFFQASGTGRGRIKNSIGICMELIELTELRVSGDDLSEYRKICSL